jgi:hypothetical protein
MTLIAKTSEQRLGQLTAVFREVLATVPTGAATLESIRTENDDGTIVWLKPLNSRSAQFSAHIEDGHPSLIDVSFGSGTTLELPWEAKLPNDATFEMVLEVVKHLALAVVAGQCEERFGFLGIRGTIRVDARNVYRCTHFFYPRFSPRTVRYQPYSTQTGPAETQL